MSEQLLEKIIQKKAIIEKFLDDKQRESGINYLQYGEEIGIFMEKVEPMKKFNVFILQDPENNNDHLLLQWISSQQKNINTQAFASQQLDTLTIIQFNEEVGSNNSPIQSQKEQQQLIFSIEYKNPNSKAQKINFCFQNYEEKQMWIYGFYYFMERFLQKYVNTTQLEKLIIEYFGNQDQKKPQKVLKCDDSYKILKNLGIKCNKNFFQSILFPQIDKNNDGTMDKDEFIKIYNQLVNKIELRDLFLKYSEMGNQDLSKQEKGQKNKGLQQIRHTIESQDNSKEFFQYIDLEHLKKFYENEQKQTFPMSHLQQFMLNEKKYIQDSISQSKKLQETKIDFYQFQKLIYSSENSLFDPDKLQIYQDMDQPLTDYYINSSHNTYLTSNQLTGKSDINCYIKALNDGVRCVEIDCWNGDNGQPIVTHGYTLTSSILVSDVFLTIKQNAFKNSPYPVILSIENHCNSKQRAVLAKLMKETFGSYLFTIPENHEEFNFFSSPNDLKYKIIIKDKCLIRDVDTYSGYNVSFQKFQYKSSETLELSQFTLSQNSQASTPKNHSNLKQQIQYPDTSLSDFSGKRYKRFVPPVIKWKIEYLQKVLLKLSNGREQDFSEYMDLKLQNKFLQQYSSYNASTLHGDFDLLMADHSEKLQNYVSLFTVKMPKINYFKKFVETIESIRKIWEISSVSENKLEKYLKFFPKQLINFHKKYFSRVYPKGTRINSSNYDPMKGFSVGSQLIALNYQTKDLPLLIYKGKFLQNGGKKSGYVLKPNWLSSQTLISGQKYLEDFTKVQAQLQLKILSGEQLLSSIMRSTQGNYSDKSVSVQVFLKGIEQDEQQNNVFKVKQQVNAVSLNTLFETNQINFNICNIDIAIIVFLVFLSTEIIGQYAIPFSCIRQGYRTVSMMDNNLELIKSSYLLVHSTILML